MKKIKVIILTTILALLIALSFGMANNFMEANNNKIDESNMVAAVTYNCTGYRVTSCTFYGANSKYDSGYTDCNSYGGYVLGGFYTTNSLGAGTSYVCSRPSSTSTHKNGYYCTKQKYSNPNSTSKIPGLTCIQNAVTTKSTTTARTAKSSGCYNCGNIYRYYNSGASLPSQCGNMPVSTYQPNVTTNGSLCSEKKTQSTQSSTQKITNKTIRVTIKPNGGAMSSTEFGFSNRTWDFSTSLVQPGNFNLGYFKMDRTRGDGYLFAGWGGNADCTSGSTSNVYLDYGLSTTNDVIDYTFYACWKKSGSSSLSIPVNPVTPPSTTTTKNAYFYASDKEYSGDTIVCGDKVYVTTCTGGSNSICEVTVINTAKVSTTTKIYEKNLKSSFESASCSNLIRYAKEETTYCKDITCPAGAEKPLLPCGSKLTLTKSLGDSCVNGICEVKYNNQNIYVRLNEIVSYEPVCSSSSKCESSAKITNAKKNTTMKICNSDSSENYINNIFTCADGYQRDYKLVETKDDYKVYEFWCDYLKRPSLSASGGTVNSTGTGTIKFTATDNGGYGLKGYFISNGAAPSVTSAWIGYSNNSYSEQVNKPAGTYFVWTMNGKNRISYPIMTKVYDGDLSNTLKTFKVTDASGKEVNVSKLDDGTLSYENGIVDGTYALLSNSLLNDSSLALFDQLSTGYELTVNSNKIALYATLTEEDASYVAGFEPRTVDLEYGRNVVLIKIVNKKGKERTYTFIVNRVDDRSNNNLLANLTVSKGEISFDPYVTDYTISIPSNTEKVSINAELQAAEAAFVKGYEPREIEMTSDAVSAVIKTVSASGSVRSYVITFVRNGAEVDDSESAYLSSLTVPGTALGFDKKTYNYNVSVEYEVEDIPVYAFAESENAKVTISETSGLKVGTNLIEITVTNGSKTKVYTVHVIRKSSGLEVSDDTKLGSLTIKGYDIDFDPEILDYKLKIKYDKTLLIAATPASNRSDIYMYGNNDLTGFSTVRIKVVAENGKTLIYSIDIEKDVYNKTLEIIAASVGGLIIISTAIIIVIKKRKKKMKEYMEV